MWAWLKRVACRVFHYVAERLTERSTAAGAVAVATVALKVTVPPGIDTLLVNAVVAVAGVVAMLVPGGK